MFKIVLYDHYYCCSVTMSIFSPDFTKLNILWLNYLKFCQCCYITNNELLVFLTLVFIITIFLLTLYLVCSFFNFLIWKVKFLMRYFLFHHISIYSPKALPQIHLVSLSILCFYCCLSSDRLFYYLKRGIRVSNYKIELYVSAFSIIRFCFVHFEFLLLGKCML